MLKIQNTSEVLKAYNSVAKQYADKYGDEIELKPLVQNYIKDFCSLISKDDVICDMGCGPGQVARYLRKTGFLSCGIDLSKEMIKHARELNPDIPFICADIFDYNLCEKYNAIIGLYFIVNFPVTQLEDVFNRVNGLLNTGGYLLISFHIGNDEIMRVENMWESGKPIDFFFFHPDTIQKIMAKCGFHIDEVRIRDPYKNVEYESRRAYVFAKKVS